MYFRGLRERIICYVEEIKKKICGLVYKICYNIVFKDLIFLFLWENYIIKL